MLVGFCPNEVILMGITYFLDENHHGRPRAEWDALNYLTPQKNGD